ncbi:hypothetical protein ABGB18_24250 [Nonomuraea sp. B12E4]|uniref:alpha/beta fold hydrolase n=1 Tax=Nonomuraea sp. B12E4 TaxID=3153564 RepID=UPI00325F2311
MASRADFSMPNEQRSSISRHRSHVFFDVSWARRLQDKIPGVRGLVEIEGGRLFFPEERAAELVPHLRRFWAGE